MSSIFKLSIQGVRSFDNADRQTIQFGTPLTLIVGPNGTGKTTIIECLRYATTGDLPPNSKGGAFIHDAKFSGEKEVLAQVKLAFYNTNGVQMICTRSLQLQMKKTQRSVKTLDGQLVALDGTKRTTLNTRCADIDKEMPLYLGASKAILDYVIFCHQEDSLWPLAEPSVVKKRFDEIFEATKFTKALDAMRVLRKDYAQEIKLKEKDVQYLQTEQERAERTRSQSEELKSQKEAYLSEAEELKTQMEQLRAKSTKLFESNQRFQEILYKLDNTKKAYAYKETTLERIHDGLVEMTESDEELQALLDNFETRTRDREAYRDSVDRQLTGKKNEMDDYRKDHNKASQLLGQLESEAKVYDENVKKRKEFAAKMAKELELVADTTEENFSSQLYKLKEKLTREEEQNRQETTEQTEAINKQIQEYSGKRASAQQRKESHKNELSNIQQELSSLESDIDSIDVDEATVASAKRQLVELQDRLSGVKNRIVQENITARVAECNAEVEKIEGVIEKLNAELAEFNKQSDVRARLGFLQEEQEKKKAGLDALEDAHREAFHNIGIDLKENRHSELDSQIRQSISSAQKLLDDQMASLDSLRREGSQLETRARLLSEEITKQKKEAQDLHNSLTTQIDESILSQFDEEIAHIEKDVAEITADIGTAQFTTRYYAKARELAKDGHKCLLCDREFAEESDVHDFVLRVDANTAQLPDRLAQLDQDLTDNTDYLEKLRRLKPSLERISVLEERIPALSDDEANLRNQMTRSTRSVEEAEQEVVDLKAKLGDIERLRRVGSDISRMRRELVSLDGQISELAIECGSNSISQRNAAEIHVELSQQHTAAKAAKQNLRELTEIKEELTTQCTSMENSISTRKVDISQLESKLTEKNTKRQRVNKLRQDMDERHERIRQANVEIDSVTPRISELENERDKIRLAGADKSAVITRRLNAVTGAIGRLDAIDSEMAQFLARGGRLRLDETQASMQELQQRMTQVDEDIVKIEKQLLDANTALVDMRGQERQLKDNIEARRLGREMETDMKVIRELESHNARQEKEQYDKQAAKLSDELAKANSKYSSKMGEVKQLDDQIERLQIQLDTEYSKVADEYAAAQVTLQTTVMANEDLATYSKALDSAIMRYHSMKMEEINRIVDELWKKTYTGSDIDTIVIRSEHETRGNRTYNYRVCMIKQDVELDMRGRCSAGQKVLASIIIRLALSECFGVSCGLIALDEPTTNLDEQNIESLAQALASIIEQRQRQRNFQLIVITHDEQFLTHMNASAYADHYFRLSRNANQKSEIHCVPV